jgi:hypothetical protein
MREILKQTIHFPAERRETLKRFPFHQCHRMFSLSQSVMFSPIFPMWYGLTCHMSQHVTFALGGSKMRASSHAPARFANRGKCAGL